MKIINPQSWTFEQDWFNEIKITVSLLRQNNDVIVSKKANLLELPSIGIDMPHEFSLSIEGTNAVYALVYIEKYGYKNFSRKFLIEPEIRISAILDKVNLYGTFGVNSAMSVSGEKISPAIDVVNRDELGNPVVSVFIPSDIISGDPGFFYYDIKPYDLIDPMSAAYYPGEMVDNQQKKLSPISFDYVQVLRGEGVEIPLGDLPIVRAEPIVINRVISDEGCAILKTVIDFNTTAQGVQIPFYIFDSQKGYQEFIADGSIYKSDGSLLLSTNDIDCESTTYVFEVKAPYRILKSNWWSIAYAPDETVLPMRCANIKLVDLGGNPIIGSQVYVHDDDTENSYAGVNYITNLQGEINIKLLARQEAEADLTAELHMWMPSIWQVVSHVFELSDSCGSIPTTTTLNVPAMCKIEGSLVDINSEKIVNGLIFSLSPINDNLNFPAFGFTDKNGKYNVDVLCQEDYELKDFGSWYNSVAKEEALGDPQLITNVNQSVGGQEISDDGKIAIIEDHVIDTSKPFGFIIYPYNNSDVLKIFLKFYYRGDHYPLSFSFDLINRADGNALPRRYQGTLTRDDLILADSTNKEGFFAWGQIDLGGLIVEQSLDQFDVVGEISDSVGNNGVIGQKETLDFTLND